MFGRRAAGTSLDEAPEILRPVAHDTAIGELNPPWAPAQPTPSLQRFPRQPQKDGRGGLIGQRLEAQRVKRLSRRVAHRLSPFAILHAPFSCGRNHRACSHTKQVAVHVHGYDGVPGATAQRRSAVLTQASTFSFTFRRPFLLPDRPRPELALAESTTPRSRRLPFRGRPGEVPASVGGFAMRRVLSHFGTPGERGLRRCSLGRGVRSPGRGAGDVVDSWRHSDPRDSTGGEGRLDRNVVLCFGRPVAGISASPAPAVWASSVEPRQGLHCRRSLLASVLRGRDLVFGGLCQIAVGVVLVLVGRSNQRPVGVEVALASVPWGHLTVSSATRNLT